MRKTILVLAVILALVLCGCNAKSTETAAGQSAVQTEAPLTNSGAVPSPEASAIEQKDGFDKDQYISTAQSLSDRIYASAVDFANVLNFELSFADSLKKIGGTYTAEKGRESGIENYSKKSGNTWDTIVQNREAVVVAYKSFIATGPSSDMVCAEIRDYIKTMYEAYNKLYYAADSPTIDALTKAFDDISTVDETYTTLKDSYF